MVGVKNKEKKVTKKVARLGGNQGIMLGQFSE